MGFIETVPTDVVINIPHKLTAHKEYRASCLNENGLSKQ